MIKTVFLFLSFLFAAFFSYAQADAQFSQYIFNGLYINPAYAGYKDDLYLNSFYRSQWTGIDGAPQTVSIAADEAVADGKVGLGIMIQSDSEGAQSNIAAYGNYAYRIQMGEDEHSKLAFGLGFGFIQSGINGAKLTAVQNNDTYVPYTSVSVILPDARFGVLYTDNDFFVGLSVDNILAKFIHTSSSNALLVPIPKPNEYFTTGALFTLNDDVKFKPSILIRDNPDNPTSMDFNTFLLLGEKLWVGGTYRTDIKLYDKPNLQNGLQKSNALVAMTEFFINENFRIGYAFDYSLNKIGSYGYGSHELSISILLKKTKTVSNAGQFYF
jgi:type IX secretion system PorP/SprF family membrane protein